jgi:hypothetical protein
VLLPSDKVFREFFFRESNVREELLRVHAQTVVHSSQHSSLGEYDTRVRVKNNYIYVDILFLYYKIYTRTSIKTKLTLSRRQRLTG